MINEISDLDTNIGARLVNFNYKDLSVLEVAEVYVYVLQKYGRDHIRTTLVRDYLDNLKDIMRADILDRVKEDVRSEIEAEYEDYGYEDDIDDIKEDFGREIISFIESRI